MENILGDIMEERVREHPVNMRANELFGHGNESTDRLQSCMMNPGRRKCG